MIRGNCFDWTIESQTEFELLRPGRAGQTLNVGTWSAGDNPTAGGELLVRWRRRPDRPFHGSVHRVADGSLVISTSDAGWFRVDVDNAVVEMPSSGDSLTREVRLWTTPMLLLNTVIGRTPLHAACVQVGDKAVAIGGPGGAGKTTLAAGLLRRGHKLLAEDVTIVGDGCRVLPGPNVLRLRPSAAERGIASDEVEVLKRDATRMIARPSSPASGRVSLDALVLLKEGDSPAVTLRTDGRRIADLWKLSFHMPNLTDRGRAFNSITELADRVPIFDLVRPLEWSSLDWSVQQIEKLIDT